MGGRPSVEAVAAFVREAAGVGRRRPVGPETRLEADLGITGDDGADLLDAACRRFAVNLASLERGVAATLALGPGETLFGPEGFDPLGVSRLVRLFRNVPGPAVRDLTVAELHRAILAAPPLEGHP